MRNRCPHKAVSQLITSVTYGARWEWCRNCGATRMSTYHPSESDFGQYAWTAGKWVSPKKAREDSGDVEANLPRLKKEISK